MTGRWREQGSILTASLVVSVILGGALSAIFLLAHAEVASARRFSDSIDALETAYSDLAIAREVIANSSYDAAQGVAGGSPAYVPGTTVEIESMGGVWYRLTATATYDVSATREVTEVMREYDYASKYLFLCDDSMGFYAKRVDGAIHSNRYIDFHQSGGDYGPDVTCVEGVNYSTGATASNTTIRGVFDPAADPIDFATLTTNAFSSLSTLAAAAEPGFSFDDAATTRIRFVAGTVGQRLVIDRVSGGTIISSVDVDAPSNGVVYSTGDVEVSGDIVGQLTVGAEGMIRILDSLVYRDGAGESAYLNGDSATLPYEPNPSYTGDATLGLVARSHIEIDKNVSTSFEMNASMLSLEGSIRLEGLQVNASGQVTHYDSAFVKDSYRLLGSMSSASRMGLVVSSNSGVIQSGFKSGTAKYDAQLGERSPPEYPAYEDPVFFGARVK